MMRPRRAVLGAVVALVAAACGSGGDGGSANTAPRPRSAATLRIVEPDPGAVVDGPTVRVKLELTGGQVIQQTTKDVKPDEGHIHVSVDGRSVSLLSGLEEEVSDLAAGTHVLQVEFVAGDHKPFNPRVVQQSTFTVK